MLNRSIERDYDIAYHIRALHKCLDDIKYHVLALRDVDFDPYHEIKYAEDQVAVLHEVDGD